MYNSISDFIIEWKNESSSTLKVLNAITDSSLSQKVTPEGRSLGFIAWHIVLTLGEICDKAGLAIEAPAENSPPPQSASAIVSVYHQAAKTLGIEILKRWNDKMLDEVIEIYGEKWTRTKTLAVLLKHEVHHRAQITVLMRQAGLKVPGVYGPAKEEWASYGMPPMA